MTGWSFTARTPVATPSVTVTVHAQVSGQSCGQAPGTWMVVIGCSSGV